MVETETKAVNGLGLFDDLASGSYGQNSVAEDLAIERLAFRQYTYPPTPLVSIVHEDKFIDEHGMEQCVGLHREVDHPTD